MARQSAEGGTIVRTLRRDGAGPEMSQQFAVVAVVWLEVIRHVFLANMQIVQDMQIVQIMQIVQNRAALLFLC